MNCGTGWGGNCCWIIILILIACCCCGGAGGWGGIGGCNQGCGNNPIGCCGC